MQLNSLANVLSITSPEGTIVILNQEYEIEVILEFHKTV